MRVVPDDLRGVDQEDWESMHNTLREAAKKVGIKKIGERTSLLWKLSEQKTARYLCLNENMKGQVKNRTQARKDLWEVWAASPVDAPRICRKRVEGGAEGSSTYCSLKEGRRA